MADKRISQLIDRGTVLNNDVIPIVVSGAVTTNKATISSIQTFMQSNLDVGVTSVGITIGSTGTDVNVTGSPVTSSGNITINLPTASATNRGLLSSANWTTFNNKVSSVGLSMPSAFSVANSPITGSGTIAVTGAGTVAQYIRGDGSLADFPSGGGGGGSSVNYYLNGSVSQGTIGGVAYLEINKTPILGAGTDFTIAADGYIASFITDAGDPALLEIPAGNWNFESYFSASSGGGSPSFYIELYKVNSGGTATLIASSSATPELISFGTSISPYFSPLAVPTTVLTVTDRLAVRYYVTHSGRTITLHTENSHLCQIITTFTTGLTALNGLTAQVQNFATGTSGTDFAISSSVSTHTFNLPDASASARGVVTTGTQTFAGYKIFNGTIGVNNDLQLVTVGTALNTFIKNINATGLTSIGSNGFGFNNANNIYFSGSSKGGGIFAFSNTGNQTYTLQDASGTLAFTSDISNSLTGYVTLATTQTITGAKTFDSTTSEFAGFNSTNANGGTLTFRRSGTNVGHIGNSGVLGVGILDDLEVRSGIGKGVHLKTDGGQLTLATGGGVTLTGALNGTSASFSGTITSTVGNNSTLLNSASATNGWVQIAMNNTTGSTLLGIEGATAGTLATGTNAYASVLRNYTATDFQIATNNIVRLTLASTGAATFSSSVGVGLSGTPAKTLEVRGTLAISNSSSSYWYMDRDDSDGRFKILTDTDNERLSILTGGNVGICTPSPTAKLQITSTSAGAATVGLFLNNNSTTSSTETRIAFAANANDDIATNRYSYISALNTSGSNGQALIFATNETGAAGTERMRITSGGFLKASNTGIYLGATQTYHELRSDLSNENVAIFQNTSASPYGPNISFGGAAPNNTTNYFLICSDTSSNRFIVYSNGNVANSNNSYGSISDIKLKENIEDATPKLDDLMKVKVRNYNLIGDDKKQIGVIAQELEEVFPAMIDESEDFEDVEVPQVDEEGNEVLNEEGEVVTEKQRVSKGTTTKSVKYSVFVPMLIKAIQELKTEIDSLKNQMQ